MDQDKSMGWLRTELDEVHTRMVEAFQHAPLKDELARLARQTVANPGKMVRPVVMLLMAGDYDKDVREELLCTVAAIEASHTASLVLDDMVDDADLRRGEPTINATYGSDVALYVGLSLLMGTQEYALAQGLVRTAAAIAHTVQVMCGGEMTQHANQHNVAVAEHDYLKAIRGKTAALFECLGTLACEITKKDEAYTQAMGELGQILGTMFQIRDDLVDWTASVEQAGKPVNEDFAAGIYTLPALHAMSTLGCDGSGERLRALALRDALSAEELAETRELVERAGGIDYARERMAGMATQAHDIVSRHSTGRYAEGLHMIIDRLMV